VGCNDRANAAPAHRQKARRPKGFSSKQPPGFVAPRSKTHEGYFLSSRLANQLFARKQHPSEFSDRLLVVKSKQMSKLVKWRNPTRTPNVRQ